jgi:hypothetical protein
MFGCTNTVKALSVQVMTFIWAHRLVQCNPASAPAFQP